MVIPVIDQHLLRLAALGCSDKHISVYDQAVALHIDVIPAWQALCDAAKKAGFQLTIASGYRDFNRQKAIWNAKLTGHRPILDREGAPQDISQLSALDAIEQICHWSAIPGASRHHWGTDMDIYDKAAISDSYTLQLTPDEYQNNGPFAPMVDWLRSYIEEQPSTEFFFPYTTDAGGIMPEPWHLSYWPIAQKYQQAWSLTALKEQLRASDLLEKDVIVENLNELYERYMRQSIYPPCKEHD